MSDMVSLGNPLWVSQANNQTPRATPISVVPALAQPSDTLMGNAIGILKTKATIKELSDTEIVIKITNMIFQELQMLYFGYDELSVPARLQRLQRAYSNLETLGAKIEEGNFSDKVKHMLLFRIKQSQQSIITFGMETLPGGLNPLEMKALLSPRDKNGDKDPNYDRAREKLNRAAKEELIKRLPEKSALTQGNHTASHGKQVDTTQRTLAELNGLMMLASKTGDTLADTVPNVESDQLAKN
jgi:hypothetical protein